MTGLLWGREEGEVLSVVKHRGSCRLGDDKETAKKENNREPPLPGVAVGGFRPGCQACCWLGSDRTHLPYRQILFSSVSAIRHSGRLSQVGRKQKHEASSPRHVQERFHGQKPRRGPPGHPQEGSLVQDSAQLSLPRVQGP